MSDATTPAASRFANINRRNLLIALGVWVAVVGIALGISAALDDPPKPVASAIPAGLPDLRLYLDRQFPASVRDEKTAQGQILRLREIATLDSTAENWVNLGAAYHSYNDVRDAALAYQRALSIDPERADARVGAILLDASGSGKEGLDRASVAISDLAEKYPKSQLVAFNQAMVAIYRSDRETLIPALDRTIALGADTNLGRMAKQFRTAATSGSAGAP